MDIRIAYNLKTLRQNKGLSLNDCANLLGLKDRSSYYAYEICKCSIPVCHLVLLAKYYKVSYSKIIDGIVSAVGCNYR